MTFFQVALVLSAILTVSYAHISFRLANGSVPEEGRIEVNYNGVWGTVCDDSFGLSEGNMVCISLGYDQVHSLYPRAAFGPGRGEIWLDDLTCAENATNLHDCYHGGWGRHNCVHAEDMGVRCQPRSDQEFRLVNGSNSHEGRVEVFHAGEWGTVCDDFFGFDEANMVCRTLGYGSASMVAPRSRFGEGIDPIWLDNLHCPSNATSVGDCNHRGWGSHNCRHYEDVGLACATAVPTTSDPNPHALTTESDISEVFRLVNGSSTHEGRIEVFHAGQWGTVCDDSFGIEEGNMVCRVLGYDRTAYLAPRARFGQGRDPIWLDDLHCPSNATSVGDCNHRGWGSHNCRHSEDMGLGCGHDMQITTEPSIGMTTFYPRDTAIAYRLVGGPMKGRIELLHNGRWGTICDDGFGWEEANVICRQLGFNVVTSLYPAARLGVGSGPIWLDDLHCSRDGLDLERCTHRGWGVHNCGHHEDMGVRCGY